MDPNLLPQDLRQQEEKELARAKRQVPAPGEVLTAPARRGKAAIDDETFRLPPRNAKPVGAKTSPAGLEAAKPAFAPAEKIVEQKFRHEDLRAKHFGEKKIASSPRPANNWHVPAEHAIGDGWFSILKRPFGRSRMKEEFYLADKAVPALAGESRKQPESAAKPSLAGQSELPANVPASASAVGNKKPAPAQPVTEKSAQQHQQEIHAHFTKYFLWLAMPVLLVAILYGLYLLLRLLPAAYSL